MSYIMYANDSNGELVTLSFLSQLMYTTQHTHFVTTHGFPSYSALRPMTLQWRHNDHDSVSNHQHHVVIQTQIKENTKVPCHWPLCGDFTGTGDFPAQRASYAENVSIWWRHHGEAAYHPYADRHNFQLSHFNFTFTVNWIEIYITRVISFCCRYVLYILHLT